VSFKPKPPRLMPKDLAELGSKLLPPSSPYRLVGEQLYEQYDEAEFADLYHVEGKPGLSPVLLSFVTAFQYLEGLSDREAAAAVRLRLDWKYALHLPLDYAGFNYSVLSEYRDRVLAHQAEARLFDRLIEQLQGLGLIKQRGRQRTDSLAVLTKVRDLNRLERVCETLRLAVRALLGADPAWTRSTVPPNWEERYGERCVATRLSEDQRQTLEHEVGSDGQWLLNRLHADMTSAVLQELPEVQVLKSVWSQQFEVVEGKIVYRAAGPYDGTAQIQTPHDPEARYSKKRNQGWIGDKLQVTETDDEDYPHLITDIATTSSVKADSTELKEIQARLEARDVLPGEHLVDAAYVSGPNLKHSQGLGVDLIGPVQGGQSPQGRKPDGITHEQFRVDREANVAICPAGQLSSKGSPHDNGGTQYRFRSNVCAACPLRDRCCNGPNGRTITLSLDHEILAAARARQETAEFKAIYRQHRGGVEGCLSVLARKYGLRVKRYIGQRKGHLQAVFTGVGVNLLRAASWLAKQRPQVRRKGLGLATMPPQCHSLLEAQ
jgi:transposase